MFRNSFLCTSIVFILILFSCKHDAFVEREGFHCVGDSIQINLKQEKPIVKFLLTSDPQYDVNFLNPDRGITLWADSVSSILKHRLFAENFEGVLLAGDLTHNGKMAEVERYRKFIDGYSEYIYDGLGNHDYRNLDGPLINEQENLDFGLKEIAEYDFPGWDHGSIESWKIVRDRVRETPTNNSFPNLHYSWDWEDVHFVQLNLFAGNQNAPHKPFHPPFYALDFLINDLKKHVKSPSQPIVLIQHYGFDDFSRTIKDEVPHFDGEWWTEEQRLAFWEVIKDYNVIAIFSGHAHNCVSCETCYLPWDGKNVGLDKVKGKYIHSFVTGASREGMYLTCYIYDEVMHIERYSFNELVYNYVVPIKRI